MNAYLQRCAILTGLFIGVGNPQDLHAQGRSQGEPFSDLAFLVGSWAGRIDGTIGSGTGQRQYRFILRGRYLLMTHASYRPPQELAPRGDAHEEWSIFSYDAEREVIVLRSFVVEGFVVRYTCVVDQNPKRITCDSEATEGSSGLRLRIVLQADADDQFTEVFEIFGPDQEVDVRFTNTWLRTG